MDIFAVYVSHKLKKQKRIDVGPNCLQNLFLPNSMLTTNYWWKRLNYNDINVQVFALVQWQAISDSSRHRGEEIDAKFFYVNHNRILLDVSPSNTVI